MRQLQVEAVQMLQPPLIQGSVYKTIAPSFDLTKLPDLAQEKENVDSAKVVKLEKEDLYKDIVHAQVPFE